MLQLFLSHIDAIIAIFCGGVIWAYSVFRRRNLSTNPSRLTQWLPRLSAVVVLFGVIQLFLPAESAPDWQRFFTDDRIASVEFPVTPEDTETIDAAGDIKVRRTTRKADVARGKVELRLSFNAYPPDAPQLTAEERLEGIRQFGLQQGMELMQQEQVEENIWAMVFSAPKYQQQISVRVSFGPEGVYRAMATSQRGFHDDPRITRFLRSFTIIGQEPGSRTE